MNTTEKAINLFQYIREVYASKNNVMIDIKKESWHQFLDEIPIHTQYIKCPFLDTSNTDDIEKNVILEVIKPELDPCPKIPAYLEPWISLDWKVASNQLTFKDKIIQNGKTVTFQEFFGNVEHQKELYDWMQKRADWVKDLAKQKKPEKVDEFFRNLWNQYEFLKQNSQSFELMIGQGILEYQQNENNIFYPILLKKVLMTFDIKDNVIRVIDTDTKSQLNVKLLKNLEIMNEEIIETLVKDLDENNYQPLDKANTRYFLEDCHKLFEEADTDSFLENLTKQIGSPSVYYKDIKQVVNTENNIVVYNRPVLFIRTIENDILQSLDAVIDDMEQTGKVPDNLLDLMKEDVVSSEIKIEKPTLSELKGESETILFSKKASKEQMDIARNIEKHNTILVQSPPGTEKAHIIANLTEHFLSQGKKVLITSPTQKTLLEIKQKIAKELQDLCISSSENDITEIERSIDTIIKFSLKHTSEDMLGEEGMLQRQRKEILSRLSEIRNEIYHIQQREYETITLNGENYSVREVADFVCENREELSYIPGKITLHKSLPVSKEALEFLYQTNAVVTQKQELELEFHLPEPRDIMPPEAFESVITERNGYTAELLQLKSKVRNRISIDFEHNIAQIGDSPLYTSLDIEKVKQIKKIFSEYSIRKYSQWQLSAVFAGKKKDNSEKKWKDLIEAIEDAYDYHDYSVEKTLRKDVDIAKEYISYKSIEILQKLQEMLKKGKKIGGLSFFIHKDWKELYETLKVNDKYISKADDCEVLIATIYMELKRNEIEELWIELIEEEGGEFFYTLGLEPERKGIEVVEKIEECLNWYQTVYQPVKNIALECGLSPACFEIADEISSPIEEAKYDMDLIYKFLPQYISIAELLGIKLSSHVTIVDETMALLQSEKFAKSSICNAILSALQEKDIEKYRKHYEELRTAHNKFDDYERRGRILEKIAVDASEWATAIQYRTGIHGASECPENVEGAWNWKQLSIMLNDIIEQPFEQLRKEESSLSAKLQNVTTKLIESKAWYSILLNLEKNKKQKQCLQQWKQSIASASLDKEEIKKLIVQYQYIVPAWIMSTNQALKELDIKQNKFDIAIIDEANQCDVSSLAMFHVAKKLIIIGDDEQIGLYSNDENIAKNENLLHSYMNGELLNEHIYNTKYSLYDIAKTTFKILMLREHIKCIQDIIGYNNRLCYNNKLELLRDNCNIFTKPHVISHYAKGKCDDKRRNIKEARNIVAFMIACMEQPEYDNMTFGAISLLGIEQANLIRQIAFQKISPETYEHRKILCGDVCCFQNNERDIVFISMVDSYDKENFVILHKNDTNKSTKQMYNVAVSRAKNQLWIVHSFDVKQELEIDDIRRNLIEYAEGIDNFKHNNKVEKNSSFETSVIDALAKQGYYILKQYEVGGYRIGLAVVYGDKKVAIECDGEEQHEKEILSNMEKEAVLERVGWNFIHIRNSEYFNNPIETIKHVISSLTQLGIMPEQDNTNKVIEEDKTLLQKIQKRAAFLVHEWEKETKQI
ncbi:AAA domain-containing protein [Clostridium sp. MD294]|uniref:AAA domain-containing protein n=1 Tax=Clostridium sp. MD294 TaxID=97138 RepID=UPI0002C9E93A|nr:AAA domain-containing protein [Clostridium sp. MD294]NDO45667.1 hypothetical protein [Clostridium sp. MD294]USF30678.1 hypothetical protein C820_002121 [Clostridium sp. MD294]